MNDAGSYKQIGDLVANHGLGVACLVLFIIGLMREWWVMGSHYRATVKDKDEFKELNRKSEDVARQILAILQTKREGS